MTNKTCGTCKYKGGAITKMDDDTFKDVDTGYFVCDLIKHGTKEEHNPGQQAMVIDGSGYYAALCVEDDFGCVKWEARRG